MGRRVGSILVILVAFLLVLMPSPWQGKAIGTSPPLQVIGFWASDATKGLAGLYENPRSITWFTPYWYSVNANGHLINRVDKASLSKVRAAHIPITPLVNDETGRQLFLLSRSTRINAARNIADMVKQEHFQGVSIDFEPAQNPLARDLTAFTRDLRDYLPSGSIITMSVVPQSGGAYQFPELIPEVNQFILMAYDQHDDGSFAGPVAATPWVQRLINRTIHYLPPQKIDLGVAVYGYTWPKGTTVGTTVPYNAVTKAMGDHAKWDAIDQETYAKFTSHGVPTVAWWESLQGMNQKIHLAKENHLGGIALWHMGYANNAVYQLLLYQVGTQPAPPKTVS